METSNFSEDKVYKKLVMDNEGIVDVVDVSEYTIVENSLDPPDHCRKNRVAERYEFFNENSTDKLKVIFNIALFIWWKCQNYFCRPLCCFLVDP